MTLQPFARSERPTIGVEWEFGVIDKDSGDLVPRADAVIDLMRQKYPDITVEREFLANTVEIVSPIYDHAGQAREFLLRAKEALDICADQVGVGLWAGGTHPYSRWYEQKLSDKQTYNEIIERTQYWGRHMLIWGIHVHIGVRHEERVWPLIHALLTKYPHILALSASSPYWQGHDTGYVSHRTLLYQQLPTAGLPPQLRTWEEYSSYMEDQLRSGVINHTGSMHFDIRPASKWGTIEVRVADSIANIDELSAIVAFIHCLTIYYDELFDESPEKLPILQPWHVEENKWRGARYGLDALVITNRHTDEVLVREDINNLLQVLNPIAHRLGCEKELEHVRWILNNGNPADRMRAALEQGVSLEDWVKNTWENTP